MTTIDNLYYTPYNNDYQVGNGEDKGGHPQGPNFWNIVIPSYITIDNKKYTITRVATKCFALLKNVQSVLMPSTITSIGINAFFDTSIRNLVVPFSVSALDDCAFNNMLQLKSIVFERGINITSVGNRLFHACNSLKRIYYCGLNDMSSLSETFLNVINIPDIITLENYPRTWRFAGQDTKQSYLCAISYRKCTVVIKKHALSFTQSLIMIVMLTKY